MVVAVGAVYEDANLRVVQILVIRHDAHHRQRQRTVVGEEDVGVTSGTWRQITVAEQLGTNNLVAVEEEGRGIFLAALRRLTTVERVANRCPLRSIVGQRQRQFGITACCNFYATFRTENGLAQHFLVGSAAVSLARCRYCLIAPVVGTVGLPAVGNIRSGLLGHTCQLVHYLATLKQVELAVLARLQTEVGVHGRHTLVLTGLVAIDNHVALGGNALVG